MGTHNIFLDAQAESMMNGRGIDREASERAVVAAMDLLEHPAWRDILKDVAREAKYARRAIFNEDATEREMAHARGSLKVLSGLVGMVYRRANKEIPADVAGLFE
jgi:hypothetical protein